MSDLKKTLMDHISKEHIIAMTSDMVRIPSYGQSGNWVQYCSKYQHERRCVYAFFQEN